MNKKNQELQRKHSELQERQRAVVDRGSIHKADRESAAQTYVLFSPPSPPFVFVTHLLSLLPNLESLRYPTSLQNLNDEAARRLLELSKFDKDCADTIFWLRSHKHLFRMEIFEPAIVSLTVPDRRFASAVEACFNPAQLRVCVLSLLGFCDDMKC